MVDKRWYLDLHISPTWIDQHVSVRFYVVDIERLMNEKILD